MKRYRPIKIHHIYFGYGYWWRDYFFFIGKHSTCFAIVPMAKEHGNAIYASNGNAIERGDIMSWSKQRQNENLHWPAPGGTHHHLHCGHLRIHRVLEGMVCKYPAHLPSQTTPTLWLQSLHDLVGLSRLCPLCGEDFPGDNRILCTPVPPLKSNRGIHDIYKRVLQLGDK